MEPKKYIVKRYSNLDHALKRDVRSALSVHHVVAKSREEAVQTISQKRNHDATFLVYEQPEPSIFELNVQYVRELRETD